MSCSMRPMPTDERDQGPDESWFHRAHGGQVPGSTERNDELVRVQGALRDAQASFKKNKSQLSAAILARGDAYPHVNDSAMVKTVYTVMIGVSYATITSPVWVLAAVYFCCMRRKAKVA